MEKEWNSQKLDFEQIFVCLCVCSCGLAAICPPTLLCVIVEIWSICFTVLCMSGITLDIYIDSLCIINQTNIFPPKVNVLVRRAFVLGNLFSSLIDHLLQNLTLEKALIVVHESNMHFH